MDTPVIRIIISRRNLRIDFINQSGKAIGVNVATGNNMLMIPACIRKENPGKQFIKYYVSLIGFYPIVLPLYSGS